MYIRTKRRCGIHVLHPLSERNKFPQCYFSYSRILYSNKSTRQETIIMTSSNVVLDNKTYVPSIDKLAFHLARVKILVSNYSVKQTRTPLNTQNSTKY